MTSSKAIAFAVLGTVSVCVSAACSDFSASDGAALPVEDGGAVEDGGTVEAGGDVVSNLPVGPIVQLQSDVLDFGMVDCGHIAGSQTVSLFNGGGQPFTFGTSLTASAPAAYQVSPASGTVSGGEKVTITVTPAAIPTTASTSNNAFGGKLVITTSVAGDKPHDVQIRQTARGAVLAFAPSSVTWSAVLQTTVAGPEMLNVVNSGNAPATVGASLAGPQASSFTLSITSGTSSPLAPLALAPSFAPGSQGTYTADVVLATSSTLCAPLPAPATLSGTATCAPYGGACTATSQCCGGSGLACGGSGPVTHCFYPG